MYSGDNTEHFQIGVNFDPRRPPTPQKLTKSMWSEVKRLREELFLLQPPPQQPCSASRAITDKSTEEPEWRVFNDWGGRGYDDFVPGEVTKTTASGDETT